MRREGFPVVLWTIIKRLVIRYRLGAPHASFAPCHVTIEQRQMGQARGHGRGLSPGAGLPRSFKELPQSVAREPIAAEVLHLSGRTR